MEREYEAILRENLKMTGVAIDQVIQLMKETDELEEKLLKKTQQCEALKKLNDELRTKYSTVRNKYHNLSSTYYLLTGDRKSFSANETIAYIKEHDAFPPGTPKSKLVHPSTLKRAKAMIAFYESGEDDAMLPICTDSKGGRPTSEISSYRSMMRYLCIPAIIYSKDDRVWARIRKQGD